MCNGHFTLRQLLIKPGRGIITVGCVYSTNNNTICEKVNKLVAQN